jgi:hypothetical protein
MTSGYLKIQMTEARRALARMQDVPIGWKDTNIYRRILIPPALQRTLRKLGSVGDTDRQCTAVFNRLDEKKNVGVLV